MQARTHLDVGTGRGRRSRQGDLSFALALAALILFLASLALPLVRARLFGDVHAGYLLSGVRSLWVDGDHVLALVVVSTGVLVPLGLSGVLCSLFFLRSPTGSVTSAPARLFRLAQTIEHWAMPEVQVLGVLVAFTKLSALVPSRPAAGLVCYAGAAFLQLLAWRRFRAERERLRSDVSTSPSSA